MATYEITAPDGSVYEIDAPDDATPDQVMAYARNNIGNAAPAAQAPEYSPTEGMSGVDRALAGAGKFFVDTARGAGQILGMVSPQEVDEANRLDAPLMETGAGRAGYIGGALAGALPAMAIPGGQTVGGAALVGAGMGALQPVGENASRAANITTGALLGGGTTAGLKAVGRIAKPIQTPRNPVDARAAKTLEGAGVKLDAAQRSGSPALARLKSGLPDNPVFVDRVAAQQAAQQGQFNSAVLKSIGETAEAATDDVMGRAYTRIGQVFDDVLGKYSVKPTPAEINKVGVIGNRAARVLNNDDRVGKIIADIGEHVKSNGGKLDGRFYQTLRGDLGALERQRDIGPIARELRETLDDAFTRTAGPADAKRLVDARRQWRNMRIIENAIDTEGAGNISPAKLANQFGQKKNRSVGTYGKGDKSVVELSKLAKAGKRLLTEKTPNSGTPARLNLRANSLLLTGADAAVKAPQYQAIYGGGAASNWLGQGLPGGNALLDITNRLTPAASRLVPAYLLANSSQ